MSVPRFFRSAFPSYEVIDLREYLLEGRIELHLSRKDPHPGDEASPGRHCHRCNAPLGARDEGRYRMRVEAMPVMGLRVFAHFWRHRGRCERCKKIRAERVEWIAEETPHLTQEFAWWVGRLCEIAAVSRAAELMGLDETTTWRLDFARMRRMLTHYKIPQATAISVDEVYARRKKRHAQESRDERFFTVISDLKTRRVIWVSESRRKEALDQFFVLIGAEARGMIEVIASDQHEGYAASIREHCPGAVHVLDRFHLMQIFEEAVNSTRISLHEEQTRGSDMHRLTRGGFRFLFLKKQSRRTPEERTHIESVLAENAGFAKLELIKERMLTFFDSQSAEEAHSIFEEIGDWIWQCRFEPLMRWYREFESNWECIANYFRFRVSSALSEGINNVIKMLKRRAFGYKNMEYYRLKIMQVCGYLNSRYIPSVKSLT